MKPDRIKLIVRLLPALVLALALALFVVAAKDKHGETTLIVASSNN